MTKAHLEDILALIIGGILAVPVLIGVGDISYWSYNLSDFEWTYVSTTFSLALVLALGAGIGSILTNQISGNVGRGQLTSAIFVVGGPLAYVFVPAVEHLVHFHVVTEIVFVLVTIGAYIILALLPNKELKSLF